MGCGCEQTNVKPTIYFNEITILNIDLPIINPLDELKEKIKLEFSLNNCDIGFVYSIKALLLENEQNNFESEEKKTVDSIITFEKFYVCDFFFEKEQKIQIIIYRDEKPITLMTTLASIIGSKKSTFMKQIENKEVLEIKAAKLGKDTAFVKINIILKPDDNNNNYFKNNKFIFKIKNNNKKLYSSEYISKEGLFNPVKIPCYLLKPQYTIDIINCDNNQIKVNYTKTIEQLRFRKNSNNNFQFKIPISKNLSLSIYDNSQLNENFTLFDLISSGIRIKLSIGIDFTGSNGHPLDMNTLHCIVDNKPNDYEKVIRSIGNILSNYNNEKLFPVYGFGAILDSSPYNEASMLFNVNFNDNPEIYTIDNVIKIYRQNLQKLTFSGPTYFSPIINKVINDIKVKNKNDNLEYNILMILTDGVIDDMEETIDALVEGSFEPLSVVIVGIGNADFSKMVILDGNDIPLVSRNNVNWMRDLVQFIQFNKYKEDEKALTKEILEEIPRQIVEYYTLNNYNPEKIQEIAQQNIMKNNISNVNNDKNYLENSDVLNLPTETQIMLQIKNKKNNNNIYNNNKNFTNYNNDDYNNDINNKNYNPVNCNYNNQYNNNNNDYKKNNNSFVPLINHSHYNLK